MNNKLTNQFTFALVTRGMGAGQTGRSPQPVVIGTRASYHVLPSVVCSIFYRSPRDHGSINSLALDHSVKGRKVGVGNEEKLYRLRCNINTLTLKPGGGGKQQERPVSSISSEEPLTFTTDQR